MIGVFSLNRKGGVGKTTLTCDTAIAYFLRQDFRSRDKRKLIVIDADRQGTLYSTLTQDTQMGCESDESYYERFSNKPFRPASVEHHRLRDCISQYIGVGIYPVEMMEHEKYGKMFDQTLENMRAGIETVMLDLPPFKNDYAKLLYRMSKKFDRLVPMIVTRSSQQEIKIAKKTYQYLHEQLTSGDKHVPSIEPIWIINFAQEIHEELEKEHIKQLSKELEESETMGVLIPKQDFTGAKELYSFLLEEEAQFVPLADTDVVDSSALVHGLFEVIKKRPVLDLVSFNQYRDALEVVVRHIKKDYSRNFLRDGDRPNPPWKELYVIGKHPDSKWEIEFPFQVKA